MTFASRDANAQAVEEPIPADAPVISTTFPDMDSGMGGL